MIEVIPIPPRPSIMRTTILGISMTIHQSFIRSSRSCWYYDIEIDDQYVIHGMPLNAGIDDLLSGSSEVLKDVCFKVLTEGRYYGPRDPFEHFLVLASNKYEGL